MWTDGQTIQRDEVEPWVAETFSFAAFKAKVTEKEEPHHSRIRITIEVTGPHGQPLIANGRKPIYFALKAMNGYLQFADDWTA